MKKHDEAKGEINNRKGDAEGVIKVSKSEYKARDHEAWRGKGRIVGHLKNGPQFTIKVYNKYGGAVKTVTVPKGSKAYEVEWLRAGYYKMLISAAGYKLFAVKVRVKSGNDLFLNLEFSEVKEKENNKKEVIEVELF